LKKHFYIEKHMFIFFVGFFVYIAVEVIATALDHTISRQYTAPTAWASLIGFSSIWMGFTGGALLLLLSFVMKIPKIKELSVFFKSLIGMFCITGLELVSGIILNLWCKFGIWNYGGLNFLGQIDVPHSIIWFFATPAVIWLGNLFLFYFYREGDGPYSLLWAYLHLFIPTKRLDVLSYPLYNNERVFGNNILSSFKWYLKK
jgi:hypothetical protein